MSGIFNTKTIIVVPKMLNLCKINQYVTKNIMFWNDKKYKILRMNMLMVQ